MQALILALVLTLVNCQESAYVPDFSASKTFLYNYEGVILTGLPEKGLTRAGIKLKCKVEISGDGPKLCLLRILAPDVEEFNGVWPKDPFTRSFKLAQALESQLAKPLKFDYSNGQVGNIYTAGDVSSTAVNIVRGILNLLQLNIKRTLTTYSFQEIGIEGMCHTNYIIQENKKDNQISVIKSKDLNKCEERVEKITGNAYAHACSSRGKSNKNGGAFATYNYKIKSTRSGAVILQAEAQEVHEFTPFNEMDGVVIMQARQKLVLAEVRKGFPSVAERELQNRGSLRYNFASELLQTPIQLLKSKNAGNQIIQILQHLVDKTGESSLKDAPAKFLELVQLLRVASYENLDTTWKQFSSRPEYRRWILDAVPAIANPMAIKFLRHKMEAAELTEFEAVQAVLVGLHLIKADHEAVAEAAMLLKMVNSQRDPMLYKVAILTYGSLIQRHCIGSDVCSQTALEPLHQLVSKALSGAHEDDMTLSLKALGNAGQPACIKLIQKCLPGFSSSASQLSVSVQVDAVMALRNIAMKDTRRVQDIAMQIFSNHKVHAEVRMVASLVLLETKPTLALLMNLANVLLTETNLQVASFTYSQLKALSTSRAPDLEAVAAASTIAVQILNPKLDRLGFRYSKLLRYDIFKEYFMAGFATNLLAINNAATTLPTAIISNIKAYFLGATTNLFEVGLRAEGLQEVILKRHWINPGSRTQRVNDIRDILKRLSEWKAVPTDEPLASAYLKLFGQEVFFAKLDKSSIRHAMEAFYKTEEKLPNLKDALKSLQEGVDTHWAKPLLSTEVRHIVPTCIGLPIERSMYYASVTNAGIHVQAQISPSPSSDFSVAQLLESNIKVHSKMSLSLAKDMVLFMGVNTHLLQAGVEVQAKVHALFPVNLAAAVNIKAKNFKIDIVPCRQESEVMSIRVKAYSVTRNLEDLAAVKMIPVVPAELVPNVWKESFNPGEMFTGYHARKEGRLSSEFLSKENTYSADESLHHRAAAAESRCAKASQFGFEACLEKKSVNAAFNRNSPLYWLVGEHSAKVTFKPVHTEASIEKIQLEFQAGPLAAEKMVHLVDLDETEEEDEEMETPIHKNALGKLKRILGRGNQTWSKDKLHNDTSSSSSSRSTSQSTSSSSSSSECVPQHEKHQKARSHSMRHKTSAREKSRPEQPNPKANHHHSHHQQKTKKRHSQGKQENPKHKGNSGSSSESHSTSSSSTSSSNHNAKANHEKRGRTSDHQNHSGDRKRNKADREHKAQKKHTRKHEHISSGSSSIQVQKHSSEEWGVKIPEIFEVQFKSTSTHAHSKENHKSTSRSNSKSRRSRQRSSGSGSSISSFTSGHEPRYLGEVMAPAITILARAIMSDSRHQGYQATTYFSSHAPERRMQMVLLQLDYKRPWKMCADAALAKHHKALYVRQGAKIERGAGRVELERDEAMLRWGQECQDYKIDARASTGLLSGNSAVQLQIKWEHVPSWMKRAAHRVMEFVPGIALMLGFSEKEKKSPSHQLVLRVAAPSSRTIDVIVQAPRATLYYQAIPIPFDLPLHPNPFHTPAQQTSWNYLKEIRQLLNIKHPVECEMNEQRFTTFDKRSMKCSLASTTCYCVLVQDCTNDLRFLVAMKTVARPSATHTVHLKLGTSDIKIQPANTEAPQVLFNGMLILLYNKTYENQREHITISKHESMVIVEAPKHGLERLSFNGETAKVSIASWMRGKTCGICGNADGQRQNDLLKPNQEKALSCSSFIHSWVLPDGSCSGDCNLNHQFVRLDRQILDEQEATCYSVEPVLRCLNGCVARKTYPVKIGFHCLAKGSTINQAEWQVSASQKPVHTVEEVSAHTECSCTSKCAAP
ncbi:vitellogenin-like [Ambystoma mexicanum]|uniref:vitellogenin-like n=1 Tax=Ambystoma mexicanum TaxID=8296 RepID=UPI0037E8C714